MNSFPTPAASRFFRGSFLFLLTVWACLLPREGDASGKGVSLRDGPQQPKVYELRPVVYGDFLCRFASELNQAAFLDIRPAGQFPSPAERAAGSNCCKGFLECVVNKKEVYHIALQPELEELCVFIQMMQDLVSVSIAPPADFHWDVVNLIEALPPSIKSLKLKAGWLLEDPKALRDHFCWLLGRFPNLEVISLGFPRLTDGLLKAFEAASLVPVMDLRGAEDASLIMDFGQILSLCLFATCLSPESPEDEGLLLPDRTLRPALEAIFTQACALSKREGVRLHLW